MEEPCLAESGMREMGREFSKGSEELAVLDMVQLRKIFQALKCEVRKGGEKEKQLGGAKLFSKKGITVGHRLRYGSTTACSTFINLS